MRATLTLFSVGLIALSNKIGAEPVGPRASTPGQHVYWNTTSQESSKKTQNITSETTTASTVEPTFDTETSTTSRAKAGIAEHIMHGLGATRSTTPEVTASIDTFIRPPMPLSNGSTYYQQGTTGGHSTTSRATTISTSNQTDSTLDNTATYRTACPSSDQACYRTCTDQSSACLAAIATWSASQEDHQKMMVSRFNGGTAPNYISTITYHKPSETSRSYEVSWEIWKTTNTGGLDFMGFSVTGTSTFTFSVGVAESTISATTINEDKTVTKTYQSYYSFTKPKPACITRDHGRDLAPTCGFAGDCSSCTISGGTVQLLYFPAPRTPLGERVPQPTTFPTVTETVTAVYENFTMTSPTVYISFNKAYAENECGTRVGKEYPGAILPVNITDLSSVYGGWGTVYQSDPLIPYVTTPSFRAGPFTLADLNWPPPVWAYTNQVQYVLGREIFSIITYPYNPILEVPPQIRSMDPAWKSCGLDWEGLYDPPKALQPAPAMAKPTMTVGQPTSEPPVPGSSVKSEDPSQTPAPKLPSSTGLLTEKPTDQSPETSHAPSTHSSDGPQETIQHSPTSTELQPDPKTSSEDANDTPQSSATPVQDPASKTEEATDAQTEIGHGTAPETTAPATPQTASADAGDRDSDQNFPSLDHTASGGKAGSTDIDSPASDDRTSKISNAQGNEAEPTGEAIGTSRATSPTEGAAQTTESPDSPNSAEGPGTIEADPRAQTSIDRPQTTTPTDGSDEPVFSYDPLATSEVEQGTAKISDAPDVLTAAESSMVSAESESAESQQDSTDAEGPITTMTSIIQVETTEGASNNIVVNGISLTRGAATTRYQTFYSYGSDGVVIGSSTINLATVETATGIIASQDLPSVRSTVVRFTETPNGQKVETVAFSMGTNAVTAYQSATNAAVVDSHTISAGKSAATVSDMEVSFGSDGLLVKPTADVANSGNPAAGSSGEQTPTAEALVVMPELSTTMTAVKTGAADYGLLLGTEQLSVGGSAVVVQGHTISVLSDGVAIVNSEGTRTAPFSELQSPASLASTKIVAPVPELATTLSVIQTDGPGIAVEVDGTTMSEGGPAIAVGSQTLSLATEGVVLADGEGMQTAFFSTIVPSTSPSLPRVTGNNGSSGVSNDRSPSPTFGATTATPSVSAITVTAGESGGSAVQTSRLLLVALLTAVTLLFMRL